MLIDTHAHPEQLVLKGEWTGAVARARAEGVGRIVAVGGHPSANALAVRLAGDFPGTVFAAVGYERDLAGPNAPDPATLVPLLPRSVAVGEIGLDYHHHKGAAAAQRLLCAGQLALARAWRLPAILHSREAEADTLAMVREHRDQWSGDAGRLGVLHCFSGNWDFARQLLDLGLYLSFSGMLTFKNTDALRDVARRAPADRILVETDTPYLAPIPHRGRPNEPAWLLHTAEILAEIRGTDFPAIAALTSRNAERLFGLPRRNKVSGQA